MSAHASGTLGNPIGVATLAVTNGAIDGEPFDRLQAQVNLSDRLVSIPDAYITAGSARVDLSAELQHPQESFTTGSLHASVKSTPVDLARFQSALKQWPGTSGQAQIQAELRGVLSENSRGGATKNEFALGLVNADVSLRRLRFEGQSYGDLTATARTNAQTVHYDLVSDFAGSSIHANGHTKLAPGYPTEAEVNISKLPIERVLTVAKATDIPARGLLSASGHITGTIDNPQGDLNLGLVSATLCGEPIDSAKVRLIYLPGSIEAQQAEIVAGKARITLAARFDHPAGNLRSGAMQFHLDSSGIDLARIRNVQKVRPGLGGKFKIAGDGKARLEESGTPVSLQELNLNVSMTGVSANQKVFGDLTLIANTTGSQLNVSLDSNLANASIHGDAGTQLGGDYPMHGSLKFANVTWSRIRQLLGSDSVEPATFEAVADGQLSASGPAKKVAEWRGTAEITRFSVKTVPGPETVAKSVVFENQGPLTATLDRGVARITSLRITGPQAELLASGSVSTESKALDVTLSAHANLAVLQNFSRDVTSSGNITLAAGVRGTADKPLVSGKLELQNASVNYAAVPNGISNANGVVLFNGSNASFRNLTAQTGGGALTLGGFASYSDTLRFGLRVNATNVRVRPQQGVSLVLDSNLSFTGSLQRSELTGTATVNQVTYAPQSDFGSILTRAAPPVQAASAPSPLLDNMRLDIRVRTSPSMAIQASLAQNLQSDADLQIRGTLSQPGVLGRVTLSEGQLVFFGSSYTVNSEQSPSTILCGSSLS